MPINRAVADLTLVPAAEPAAPHVPRERHALRRFVTPPAPDGWYLRAKRAADLTLSLLLMLPAAPILLLATLLVRLTSRGPAFYTQTRVGLDGRLFTIFKLRTMRHNCEARSGPLWSLPGDPRVTPLGRILRATHLDELPQLWNVVRGEMSLIGPRPERPEFVPQLERSLPAYRQRLQLRPGVTGLAQVLLPPDTDVESVRRKLAHDLYYMRHLSFWLDLRLLLCTALYALAIPFRATSRLVRLPASGEIMKAMRDVVPATTASRPRLAA
jgi:lipopolysaccharide/colanic/teichoic acid biosynthesis glycosyltransferase